MLKYQRGLCLDLEFSLILNQFFLILQITKKFETKPKK